MNGYRNSQNDLCGNPQAVWWAPAVQGQTTAIGCSACHLKCYFLLTRSLSHGCVELMMHKDTELAPLDTFTKTCHHSLCFLLKLEIAKQAADSRSAVCEASE